MILCAKRNDLMILCAKREYDNLFFLENGIKFEITFPHLPFQYKISSSCIVFFFIMCKQTHFPIERQVIFLFSRTPVRCVH
eukprot:UN11323